MDAAVVVQRFAELFCGRRDRYGVLISARHGSYRAEARALTEREYLAHLEGKIALGIYPLVPGDLTHWVVVDLDDPDEALVREVRDALSAEGLAPYIERSKRKGWHLWCFFDDWYPALAARAVVRRALRRAGLPPDTEVFPKQDRLLPNSIGNFINLPYFGALSRADGLTEDGRRVMVDAETFTPLPLTAFLDSVEATTVPDLAQPDGGRRVLRVVGGFGDRYAELAPGFVPECIRAAEEADLLRVMGPGKTLYRNEALCRIATWYLSRGEPVEAVLARAREWNARQSAPLPEREVARTVEGLAARGYNPYGCAKIRQHPVLAAACARERCPLYDSAQDESLAPPVVEAETAPPVQPTTNNGGARSPARELLDIASSFDEDEIADMLSVGWIGTYTDFFAARTRSPRVFHTFMGLALLSAAIGNRYTLYSYGAVVPNCSLYVALTGKGSIGKTTALACATAVLERVAPGLVVNDFASGPAMVTRAVRNNGQVVIAADELGVLIRSWFSNRLSGDQTSVRDLLVRWYDGTEMSRRSLRAGTPGGVDEEPPRPCVTLMGTINLATMTARNFDATSFFDAGLFSRICFVVATRDNPKRERFPFPTDDEFEMLVQPLRELRRHGTPPPANPTYILDAPGRKQEIDDLRSQWSETFSAARRYYDELGDAGLGNFLGRTEDTIVRIAALLAASESYGVPPVTIQPHHIDIAGKVLAWLFARSRSVYYDYFRKTDFEVRAGILLRYLASHGGSAPLGDVLMHLRESRRAFRELVDTLKERDEIVEVDHRTGRQGRPRRYLWLADTWYAYRDSMRAGKTFQKLREGGDDDHVLVHADGDGA